MNKIEEIKTKLKEIASRQSRLEKQIEKMEDDDLYDDALFSELTSLEEERDNLEAELDLLEKEAV